VATYAVACSPIVVALCRVSNYFHQYR